jgi:PadR family transcriptional regulator, regulatory protein PadR
LHRDETPPGTLYLLILRMLARSGEMHGYEIANSIQQISDDVLQVEEGSLYPALQRMLIKGWVTAKWGTTAGNRRARYYQLTPKEANSRMVGNPSFIRLGTSCSSSLGCPDGRDPGPHVHLAASSVFFESN